MRVIPYFAYGSNLCLSRIRNRASSATPVAVGCLPGYKILFHKRSVDGSGKCTIKNGGSEEDLVFGVVYLMDADEKDELDREEGLGVGYRESLVDVITPEGIMEARTYIACESHMDSSLKPYHWYLEYVLKGANQHHLPEYYISSLREIVAISDPDPIRAFRHRSFLFTS